MTFNYRLTTYNLQLIIVLVFPVLMSPSCKTKTTDTTSGTSTQTTLAKPAFSADSTFRFIEEQLAFGPRVPGTAAQQKCAEYFTIKLKQYTPHVITQKTNVTVYNGKSVPCINIVASFNPQIKRRLLILSHWDSRPFADQGDSAVNKPILAADDGASGCAVMLELARQLQAKDPLIGVDLLYVDVEDYGQPEYELDHKAGDFYCLGTQYWCKNPHVPNYKADNGILLDMVGAKDATFTFEGVSYQYAQKFMKEVWKNAHQLGWSNYFLTNVTEQIIDDHYYVNTIAKIPTIDIIYRSMATQSGFAPYWHTHDDDINIISKTTLQAVGETVLSTIYNY